MRHGELQTTPTIDSPNAMPMEAPRFGIGFLQGIYSNVWTDLLVFLLVSGELIVHWTAKVWPSKQPMSGLILGHSDPSAHLARPGTGHHSALRPLVLAATELMERHARELEGLKRAERFNLPSPGCRRRKKNIQPHFWCLNHIDSTLGMSSTSSTNSQVALPSRICRDFETLKTAPVIL